MYISPISKNAIRNNFFPHKENDKVKEEKDKKPLSKILYNQKKYVKMLPTKKLVSRNLDYFKRNSNKIMMRNISNLEPSIKFSSNNNSILKKEDNLMNRTKNLISYNSEIYTPKNNKHQSTTNIFNKTKYEKNNNLNPKQQNKNVTNSRKNNIFIKNFFNNELTKEKNDSQNKNKIFSYPASPKNKKNITKIFSNINGDMNNNNKIMKSFILPQKPETSFHNFSSNSYINIFNSNNNHENNNDINIKSFYNDHKNNRKNEMNINLISKSKKKNKNKSKVNYDIINNKNISAYLKKLCFNNGKYNNAINEKNNRNNNYILINHLLLNDINIAGNNNGNSMNENNMDNSSKYKIKTSRNDNASKNINSKEKIFFSKKEGDYINNDIMQLDNYLNLSETNINSENLDIKNKIDFYKTNENFNNSPEQNHFDTVRFLQRIKLSNNNVK